MLYLPPLNALKAFESAARNGGFVGAAAELNVTAAAVSQQVRNLETFYSRKLFRRLNNRIILTDAGQAILAGITPALEDLSALTRAVMFGGSRASLVISAIPSLAECWFMPVFAAYASAKEGCGSHCASKLIRWISPRARSICALVTAPRVSRGWRWCPCSVTRFCQYARRSRHGP